MLCNLKPNETSPCMKVNCAEELWVGVDDNKQYEYINFEHVEGEQKYIIDLVKNTYTDIIVEPISENETLCNKVVITKKGDKFLTAIEFTVAGQPPINKKVEGKDYYVFNVKFVGKNGELHDPKASVGPILS